MDAPNLDLEIVRLARAGDRRRAATLLVQHGASDVYALCRAMLRDGTLAEDVSQDSFVRAIAALESFRGESSVRTWLLTIARNLCLDHLARVRRAPFDTNASDDLEDHPAAVILAPELMLQREETQRALAALGEIERALVVLHYGQDVGYPELAQAFGLREGALRMRLSRAVARMRQALSDPSPAPAASVASAMERVVPARAASVRAAKTRSRAVPDAGASLFDWIRKWLARWFPAIISAPMQLDPPTSPAGTPTLRESAPAALVARLEELAATEPSPPTE